MKKQLVFMTTLFILLSQSPARAENWLANQFNRALNKIENTLYDFKKSWPDWAKEAAKYVRYSLEYYSEYNDNIFLRSSGLDDDVIQTVRQEIEIEIPGEETYFYTRFANTLPYYLDEGELIPSYEIENRLTHKLTDKLSVGASNQFYKIEDSEVGTSLGDQVLSLGYVMDRVGTEAKYQLFDNTALSIAWNFDYIDYDENRVEIFIDRDVHDIDVRLARQVCPKLDGYVGYRFRDVSFDDFDVKDSQSNIIFTGANWKCPGIFTLFAELGFEDREFDHHNSFVGTTATGVPVFGTARSNHDNLNYRLGVQTNISRFNSVSFYYDDRLYESSRSEFTHFEGHTVGVNVRQFIDPKTILFFNFYGQHQNFDSGDNVVSLFGTPSADTDVFAYSTTLRRMINPWLHCDLGYVYTQRNTDFAGEDSDNHRLRLGFKANF